MKADHFDISGMSCAACVAHVEKSVRKLSGIESVDVQLLTNSMTVHYDEAKLDAKAIEASVEAAGYGAKVRGLPGAGTAAVSDTGIAERMNAEAGLLKRRLLFSVLFLIPLLYIAMGPMMGIPVPAIFNVHRNPFTAALSELLLTLPVVFFNRAFFSRGLRSFLQRSPTMDTLVAMGSSAALLYGLYMLYRMGFAYESGATKTAAGFAHNLFFESAATILTLVTLGKYLEARAKGKTSTAITQLMDLAPKKAILIRNGAEVEVPVEEVQPGDEVAIKPGARIPVDGTIVSGSSYVDESALTGESMPVFKNPGDTVLSASVNQSGYFVFKAVRVGDDATLSQIIRLVEEAAASKAPLARLADRVSAVFVPVVLLIAFATTLTWLLLGHSLDFALTTGIAVLVISCPCALGLATPVAIMVGTGKGAENGVLFKSAVAIERARNVQTILLDKTGTVTTGKPTVTDILPMGKSTEESLLRTAAALEKQSEHPLAKAVLETARQKNLEIPPVNAFTAVPGKGIRGEMEGLPSLAGNREFLLENGFPEIPGEATQKVDALALQGKTPLYIASGTELLGILAVADPLRPGAKESIARLKAEGIRLVLLTGDNPRTAEAIAREAGIDDVRAGLLPKDKEKIVAERKALGETVAMAGDGINDAPALARADVGIAIGGGSDIALESADVILMREDLNALLTLLDLSRHVVRNIHENLFWAFIYNVLGIPIAAGVFYLSSGWLLSPMIAALAMSFSSVTVVLNALRLRRLKFSTSAERSTHKVFSKKNKESLPATGALSPNPPLPRSSRNMKTITLHIEGMTCPHCSARVEKALKAVPEVSDAAVSLEKKEAIVHCEDSLDTRILEKAVTDAGYEVTDS